MNNKNKITNFSLSVSNSSCNSRKLPVPIINHNNNEILYTKWKEIYNNEITEINNIIKNSLKNIENSGSCHFDYDKLITNFNKMMYNKSFNKNKHYNKF